MFHRPLAPTGSRALTLHINGEPCRLPITGWRPRIGGGSYTISHSPYDLPVDETCAQIAELWAAAAPAVEPEIAGWGVYEGEAMLPKSDIRPPDGMRWCGPWDIAGYVIGSNDYTNVLWKRPYARLPACEG